jgi:hypothetical protein
MEVGGVWCLVFGFVLYSYGLFGFLFFVCKNFVQRGGGG